jgi:predicted secreted protein
MTQPTVLPGTKLLILVGDGASPEVFGDPEAPAWEAKDVNALSATASGNGVMAVESFATWNEWFTSAAAKHCQIKLDSDDLGYYSGTFILSSLKFGGTRGQKVTVDVTIVNDGAIVWVDAP